MINLIKKETMINTNQFFSNIKALTGSYAPIKVQDAFSNLIMISGIVFILCLLLLAYLFPMSAGIIIVIGVSISFTVKVLQHIFTIGNYLLKGN